MIKSSLKEQLDEDLRAFYGVLMMIKFEYENQNIFKFKIFYKYQLFFIIIHYDIK